MNSRRTFSIALIFLAVITACVVPGLPTASAPLPAPTVDTGRIEAMVAETVSAAIAETEKAAPVPASTSIAITIPTTTPTSTLILEGTPAVQAGSSQSTLTQQQDGSKLFKDERAGYEIKVPANWLAVRIDQQEYADAFLLGETANTNIQQSLLSFQNEDPSALRLIAVDTQVAHIQNEFVTDMRFILDEQKTISLSSDTDLKSIAEKIPASATVFRFEVTSIKITTSASGTQFGVIEARSLFTNTSGADVTIYQKQVFFNVPAGTQSIIFTTLSDLKETLLPAFDAMLETVKISTE